MSAWDDYYETKKNEDDLKKYGEIAASMMIGLFVFFIAVSSLLVAVVKYLKDEYGPLRIASEIMGGFGISFSIALVAGGAVLLTMIDHVSIVDEPTPTPTAPAP